MINNCQVGCQEGFYTEGFSGQCKECDANCSRCMDSLLVLKERFNNQSSNPSYCFACRKEKTKDGTEKDFIVNLTTGLCQEGCSSKRTKDILVKPLEVEYCYRCLGRCQDCLIPETGNCTACSSGLFLDKETWSCLTLSETNTFWWVLAMIVMFCFLAVALLITLLVVHSMNKNQNKKVQHDRELMNILTTASGSRRSLAPGEKNPLVSNMARSRRLLSELSKSFSSKKKK